MIKEIKNWSMRYRDYEVMECTAPCSVYSVLLKNKKIENPFYGTNEKKVQDIPNHDVSFSAEYELSQKEMEEESLYLEFCGIDTLSEIYINGKMVAGTDNMHVRYRVDIRAYSKIGKNSVEVLIKSPTRYMDMMNQKENVWIVSHTYPGMSYLRKALYMGGWDWGPRLLDMGIWQPVYLNAVSGAQISDIAIEQEHHDGIVELTIKTELENETDGCELYLRFGGKEYCFDSNVCKITVTEPKLWWPNGLGEQPLYNVEVILKEDDEIKDRKEKRIGLRTLTVSQDEDEWGREFCFKVNGKKIFAKGANYIPEKNILSERSSENTRELLESCRTANFNCLRVWGGGYYPEDYFFDYCDEMGIIVWEDFMFACMDIVLTEELENSIRTEITQQVKRLRHHASLGLFCGNNEIEESFKNWGRPAPNERRIRDYCKLFHEIIPEICAEYAPSIFYWPSSPSTDGNFDTTKDDNFGDNHVWWQWKYGMPVDFFKVIFSRFCSEFGMQSISSKRDLEKVVDKKQFRLFTDQMDMHQKSDYMSTAKILRYTCEKYGYLTDMDGIIYASQICQSDAICYTAEHFRRNYGRCMGALYWQLNDVWPGFSWSSIDSRNQWKALHYDIKKSFNPILLIACNDKSTGEIYAEVINETLAEFRGRIIAEIKDMNLNTLKENAFDVAVGSFGKQKYNVFDENDMTGDKLDVFVLIRLIDNDGNEIMKKSIIFGQPYELRLLKPNIKVNVTKSEDTVTLSLSSDCLARRVMLDIPDGNSTLSDNYFDITSKGPVNIRFNSELSVNDIRSRLCIMSEFDIINRNS